MNSGIWFKELAHYFLILQTEVSHKQHNSLGFKLFSNVFQMVQAASHCPSSLPDIMAVFGGFHLPLQHPAAGYPHCIIQRRSELVRAGEGRTWSLLHCMFSLQTETKNARIGQVGIDHSSHSGPIPLLKEGHPGALGTGLCTDGS